VALSQLRLTARIDDALAAASQNTKAVNPMSLSRFDVPKSLSKKFLK
jgi:hypothetical protein